MFKQTKSFAIVGGIVLLASVLLLPPYIGNRIRPHIGNRNSTPAAPAQSTSTPTSGSRQDATSIPTRVSESTPTRTNTPTSIPRPSPTSMPGPTSSPTPLSVARPSNGIWQGYIYNGPAGSRPYFVYTPAGYQPDRAVPLIVMLHGCLQTLEELAASTQINQLADQKHFIVVYPQQTIIYDQTKCWRWFDSANQFRGSGEPAIIAGIVHTVEQNTAQWKIDQHRVYVTGISAGAAMAVVLGATYPDIFTAIGVHSGGEYGAATSPSQVATAATVGGPDPVQQGQAAYRAMGSAARVVPVIVFHGTIDFVSHPINGDQAVEQWMQTDYLASNNTYHVSFNSPSSITHGQVPGGHSYTVYRWNDNHGNEIQEYWKVDDMGHAWSGGSITGIPVDPLGPNATLAMYNFFMSHSA